MVPRPGWLPAVAPQCINIIFLLAEVISYRRTLRMRNAQFTTKSIRIANVNKLEKQTTLNASGDWFCKYGEVRWTDRYPLGGCGTGKYPVSGEGLGTRCFNNYQEINSSIEYT